MKVALVEHSVQVLMTWSFQVSLRYHFISNSTHLQGLNLTVTSWYLFDFQVPLQLLGNGRKRVLNHSRKRVTGLRCNLQITDVLAAPSPSPFFPRLCPLAGWESRQRKPMRRGGDVEQAGLAAGEGCLSVALG